MAQTGAPRNAPTVGGSIRADHDPRASCGYNPAAQDDVAHDDGPLRTLSIEDPLPVDAPVAAINTPQARSDRHRLQIEVAALLGILVLVAIAASWLIGQAGPLGWDEAVYASKSRSLLTDTPSSTWAIYRAPGLPIVGLLGGALGFTEANLRAVALAMNLMTLAIAWAFARILWGQLAAVIALLTIVGSPVAIAELALFHTDLPAAGLLLTLMLLVWYEFEHRPEPGRLLLVAAPLAALAFYIRYGSILPIGGIGIAAVVLWHRSMLRNPRLVGATIVFAAVLFAPHIFEALARTGSPLGIITSAGEQVDTSEPIETAVRYLSWLPAQLAHRLGFAVMVIGVAHGVIVALDALRRRDLTPTARRYLWLYIPAGITTVGLVVQSHPEQRYVLFPVLLAIIAGAGAVSAGVARLRSRPGLADRQHALDAAIIGGLFLVAIVAGSVGARRVVAIERESDDSRWLPAVGQLIDGDADGQCAVVTSIPPIVEWYSRCAAAQFSSAGAEALAAGSFDDPTYVVFTDIDERRASLKTIARYREIAGSAGVPSVARPPRSRSPPHAVIVSRSVAPAELLRDVVLSRVLRGLGDAARPRLRALGLRDPVQERPAPRAAEGLPALATGRIRVQRRGQVVRYDEVLDVVEPCPRAVPLRLLDRGQAGRQHQPVGDQALDARLVRAGPAAGRSARREPLDPSLLVEPAGDRIHPADAQRLLDRLLVGDAGAARSRAATKRGARRWTSRGSRSARRASRPGPTGRPSAGRRARCRRRSCSSSGFPRHDPDRERSLAARPTRPALVGLDDLVQGASEPAVRLAPGLDPQLAAQEPFELIARREPAWLALEPLDRRLAAVRARAAR